jgi:hypothetical protein
MSLTGWGSEVKQLEVENHLRDVVSRIIVQVELATSQGRTDIDLAAAKIVKSYLGLFARVLGTTNSERLGHSDQIGQRPRAHFFHDVSPMNLHGNLGKLNLGCYLFVHEARRYQSQNLSLAGSQGLKMGL